MKQLSILAIISILLLLPVENSLARSGRDTPRKKRETEESSIEDTVSLLQKPDVQESSVVSGVNNTVTSTEDPLQKPDVQESSVVSGVNNTVTSTEDPLQKPDVQESSVVSGVKNTVASTEEHILKGVIKPIEYHKISELIFDALSKNPDHVSQIDSRTEETTTFREMKDRSIRLAIWMKKLGIGPDDIIVECSHNHLDTYIPLWATFFVDAIFSAWEPNISLNKTRQLMKEYTPKLIFTNEQTADVLLEAANLENKDVKLIVFGKHSSLQSLSEILNSQIEEEVNNFAIVNEKKPDEVSVIMFSSGTTGIPKGIMLSGRSVYVTAMEGQSSDSSDVVRVMWNSILRWITGLHQSIKTVLQKKTRIIGEVFDEDQLFQMIEKHKVNIVSLPGFLVSSIAKSNYTRKYNLESLKIVTVAGVKFSRNIFLGLRHKLPGVLILHGYGSTEAGSISISSLQSEYVESVGFVVPNGQVKFVDPTLGKALGPNEVGEICVKTPAMMNGYYKNPVKTQEVFDSDGWYRTGDLGYYHENGEIFITDRVSEIIKYKYHEISPGTIESFLSSYPEVEEVAVVSIPDIRDGELPVVFIKKVPGSKVTIEEIAGILSTLKDLNQVPTRIYFLDKLPWIQNTKIARAELKKLAIDLSMEEKI